LELGIWEFAKVATVCKERWGRDWNLESWEFRVCKERWRGRDWNLEFGNHRVCKERRGPGLEFGIWEFRV
jgi:hypothetical protein